MPKSSADISLDVSHQLRNLNNLILIQIIQNKPHCTNNIIIRCKCKTKSLNPSTHNFIFRLLTGRTLQSTKEVPIISSRRGSWGTSHAPASQFTKPVHRTKSRCAKADAGRPLWPCLTPKLGWEGPKQAWSSSGSVSAFHMQTGITIHNNSHSLTKGDYIDRDSFPTAMPYYFADMVTWHYVWASCILHMDP